MATASMQNRNNPRQQQQPGQGGQQQQGPGKFKTPTTPANPPLHHHRDPSSDRQENKYFLSMFLQANLL
jgi:hypothetical protein